MARISPRRHRRITGYESGIRIDGIQEVTANLEKYFEKYKLGGKQSLKKIMILIRTAMEEERPKIPVDTGNLRASWFQTIVRAGNSYGAIFGFSANYALYVHEMVGADFTTPRWRYGPGKGRKRWYVPRPGAGPKFLETHMKRKQTAMFRILVAEMQKKTKEGV